MTIAVAEGQRYGWRGWTVRVMHVVHSPRNGAWAYVEVSGRDGPLWRKYQKLPLPAEARLLGDGAS